MAYNSHGKRIRSENLAGQVMTTAWAQFACTSVDELISAAKNAKSAKHAYDFDDIGNRKTSSERGTNSVYAANSLNQYTEISDSALFASPRETFTPQFDDDGNQTLVKTVTGIWLVAYNGENRPILWTCTQSDNPSITNNQTISMSYDRMGRRVTKNAQRFVYDGYLQIANHHSSTSTSYFNYYIWDPTEPVATRPIAWNFSTSQPSTSQLLFYTHDGNKNVSEAIASDGAIAAHYEYAPFGALTVSSGISAAVNPWRFSSEYAEDDTATIYYNYRHYEPMTGRWMSRDLHDSKKLLPHPVYDSGTTYIYVSNMPIGGTDLLGLKDGFRDCTAPKVWTTKQKGGTVPPADGCSVPAFVEKLLTGTKDNPTGFASFLDACNYHDTCYSNCQKDKDTCDNEFFTKMLLACANATARIADGKERQKKREQCDKWAGIYYNAVGAFGGSAYERRQLLNCECRCP